MAQTSLPADGYMGNGSRTTAQFQQGIEDMASVIMELVGGTAEHASVALSSDAFAPTVDCAIFPIEPQSGTTDDLATITTTSARNGSVVVIRNNSSANTITIKHGTGNLFLNDSADYAINNTNDYVAFVLRGSNWYELFRTQGNLNKVLPGSRTETSATVASGMLPITQALNKVIGEGSASDNLDGISSTFTGNLIVLRTADAADVITVRNNQTPSGGYYTILTLDGASVVLDSLTKYMVLHKDVAGTAWREIVRGGFTPETKFAANYGMFGPATSGAAAADPTQRRMVLADAPTAQIGPQQVRMYLDTADTSPIGATSANVKIGPCGGNNISLPDSSGDVFTQITFTEQTLSAGSDEFRIYDAFAYNNSGSIAVEKNAWDSGGVTSASITGCTAANPAVLTTNNSLSVNDLIYVYGITGTIGTDTYRKLNGKIWRVAARTGTTITLEAGADTTSLAYTSGGTWVKVPTSRTDALTFRNGLYLKNADKTRLYIGTFVTGGASGTAGSVIDARHARNCWSYFNRKARKLQIVADEGVASHTYTTATVRPFNRSTRNDSFTGTVMSFVIGIADEEIIGSVRQTIESTAAGGIALVQLGLDTIIPVQATSYNCISATTQTNVANQAITFSGTIIPTDPWVALASGISAGAHFLQYTEYASGGTSMTWYSDDPHYAAANIIGHW